MPTFIPNMIFLYHIMCASENLLRVAAAQSSGSLKAYFEEHLEEEKDHARWLEEDLHSIGLRVRETLIPPEAMQMVGSIYYLIFHANPVALLGYMDVYEGWSSEGFLTEASRHYPESALRTIRFHAHADKEHIKRLRSMIDGLSSDERMLVKQTHHMTLEFSRRAIEKFSEVAE